MGLLSHEVVEFQLLEGGITSSGALTGWISCVQGGLPVFLGWTPRGDDVVCWGWYPVVIVKVATLCFGGMDIPCSLGLLS